MRISDWSSDVCSSEVVLVEPESVEEVDIFVRHDLQASDDVGLVLLHEIFVVQVVVGMEAIALADEGRRPSVASAENAKLGAVDESLSAFDPAEPRNTENGIASGRERVEKYGY